MALAAPRSTVCELFSGQTSATAGAEWDRGADGGHFSVNFARRVTGEHGAVLDDAFGRRAMGRTIVDVVASPTRRRRRGVFGRRGRQTSAAARVARYWLGRRHRACLTPAFAALPPRQVWQLGGTRRCRIVSRRAARPQPAHSFERAAAPQRRRGNARPRERPTHRQNDDVAQRRRRRGNSERDRHE